MPNRPMSSVRVSSMTAILFCLAVSPGFCANIDWTTWTSQGSSSTATGTLLAGSTPVTISYTGEIAFTQLNGTGTNYYQPSSTFTASPTVPNSPPSDMIAIEGTASNHVITFSAPVTNPILEVVSLGTPSLGTEYDFSLSSGQSMSILAQGPSNVYGGCDAEPCLSLSGSTLTGHEADGVIEFTGTFSSISWTAANPEYWNGFTFGVTGLAAPGTPGVPEPATWQYALISVFATMLLVWMRRLHGRKPGVS